MNNLITRKIVLGMLMALVLAFSVQGTADALEFRDHSSTDGDLKTVFPDGEFKIKFSVSLKSNTSIKDANGNLIDEDDNRIDSSGYFIAQDTSDSDEDGNTDEFLRTPVNDADKPTTSKRYHYSDEAVMITVTGPAELKEVGSRDISGKTHTLSEMGKDENKLSSSITLTLLADNTGPAPIQITIADATPEADLPDGTADHAPDFAFTVYMVHFETAPPAVPANSSITLESDNRFVARSGRVDQAVTVTDSSNALPLIFEVIEGSGRFYVKKGIRESSTAKTVLISSDAATTDGDAGSAVYLDMGGTTNKISVSISGDLSADANKIVTYIYDGGRLEITHGNNQSGAAGGRLEEHLGVRVIDGKNKGVPEVIVEFEPASGVTGGQLVAYTGTIVYLKTDGTLEDITGDTPDTTPSILREITPTNFPAPANRIFVQTDRSGEAKAYYQVGESPDTQYVDVSATTSAVGAARNLLLRPPFTVSKLDSNVSARLIIVDGDGQSEEAETPLDDPLIVRVRNIYNDRISGVNVRFTTTEGVISLSRGAVSNSDAENEDDISSPIKSGEEIFAKTDASGEVWVIYTVGSNAGAQSVRVEIASEQDVDLEYDFETLPVTFYINGGASSTGRGGTTGGGTTGGGTTGGGTTGGTGTLTVRPTSITGQPGSEHDITISASAGVVTVGNLISGEFLSAGGTADPRTSSGTFTSTLTLPNTQGTYNLVVSSRDATETIRVTVTSTAAGIQTGGTLAVRVNPASGAPGTTATVTVTATGDDGNAAANVPVTLSITSGGGTFSLSTVTTGANGVASSSLTRGSTPGIEYFITATATGYTQQSVLTQGERVRITGTAPPSSETRTTGDPDILDIYDGDDQSGAVNSPLADPLTVEILDANGNPVENVSVRFRVTRGRARLSPARPRTDDDGYAETTVTPRSPGQITITATVNGLDDTATFTITAGDPADALVKVSGDGQNGTPGSALANPFVVEVQDEDGEGIAGYRVSFAVTAGGGSLSETSASTNASGRAQTTLTLGSDPGINSVQASVSGVDSVIFNTSIDPKILVAAANRPVMYWIDNGMLYGLAGAKAAKIAEGANGVAVGGGKIYWTSQTSASAGAINSANLDGTDAATLTSIMAVPMGIAVDTAGSKLYWTNTRGRIQSANLDGSGIQNVVQDLSGPTDIVVSNGFIYWTEGGNSVRRVNISGQKIAIDVAVNLDSVGGLAVGGGKVYWTEMTSASAGTVNGSNLNGTNFAALATLRSAPMGISVDTAGSKLYWTNARGRVQSANLNGSMIKNVVEGLISPSKLAIGGANTATTTTAKKATTPAKKDNAAYDVNGDGAVDNTDASLVAAAMNTSNTKYDVNGDGTVNFLDLLLVFDNRDDTAAAAPIVVGMKLSAVQIDVIEEQIDLLIATNDRSPAAMRTLVYLQQLLVTARPEKTQLFANYPNPFNPETWIPYELATDTHVTITIYNTQGVVIRTLQFGHQSAGYYTGRDRAAYWDGRNALGEQVASGLYFYQLETDTMSSMRKMVILK